MALQNSQNKSNSESNVSKNSTQPCCSNSSKCRVQKLIRKYECLTTKNIRSRCCSEQYVEQCGEMNKNNVHRFLSLDEKVSDKYSVQSDKMSKKSNSKFFIKNEEKKKSIPSTSRRKEDLFARFFSFEDKSRKETISSTLPNRKSQEFKTKNVARSASATIKDKKLTYLSTNQDKLTKNSQDGGFVLSRVSVFNKTGTVPKQTNVEEVTYRKRRDSYVLATQDPDFRKFKIHPEQTDHNKNPKKEPPKKELLKNEEENIPRRSYVEKTISKFENDCFTLPKKKIEQSINQLFQQYHDKKMGTSDKMTREELNLEIDNVLLNKFKQISQDNSTEVHADYIGNHTVLQPQISTAENSEQETPDIDRKNEQEQNVTTENNDNEYVTMVKNTDDDNFISQPPENLEQEVAENSEQVSEETEYVIIVKNADGETSDVIHTSNLYLDSDDNSDNNNILRGSVENLCEDLKKVISNISASSKIKGIYVSSENMVENFEEPDHIYENLKCSEDKIQARKLQESDQDVSNYEHVLHVNDNLEFELRDSDNKPVKKVSDLVSYFSDIISDSSSNRKSATSLNRTFSNVQDLYKHEFGNTINDTDSLSSEASLILESEIDEVDASSSAENLQINLQKRDSFLHKNSANNDEETIINNSTVPEGNITEISASNYMVNTNRLTLEEKPSNIVKSNSFNEDKIRPKSVNIPRNSSFKDDSKRYSFLQYVHAQTKLFKKEKTNEPKNLEKSDSFKSQNNSNPSSANVSRNNSYKLFKKEKTNETTNLEKSESFRSQNNSNPSSANVSRNSSFTDEKKRNSFLHRKNSDQSQKSQQEGNSRFSRLYSGKFKRNTIQVTDKQDTNNNIQIESTTEQQCPINEKILNDTEFYSDSDGDYSYAEAYNPNFDLLHEHSTSEWVQKTIDRIDRIRMVDEMFKKENIYENKNNEENIYENLRRAGSTDTIHVICDEDNIPVIRMSMMDLSGEYVSLMELEEMRIKESEKELMKNIDEIRDNTKKACLINELIATEKTYINKSLHRLVHDYMPEMDKEHIPKGLLGKCRQIFGNADLLYEGHKEKFLPELENYSCIEDIGRAFLNNESIFKYYPLYSKNKPKSDIVMKDHASFFERKQKELNDKLDLASYLLTPVQRLAKYCQLVGSLVKECEKEHIECHKLKAAHEMLNKQMRMGNDLIALDAIVGFNGSILDLGELLLRDVFMVHPPNKRPPYEGMIFLFQRCLMITAINRQDYKETFVYRESFQLTDMGHSDFAPLEFSVWYRKRDCNMYKFVTKIIEIKQKWVKEIFNLLWKQLEANKRQRKKEFEDNGFVITKIPIEQIRPYSTPNHETESTSKAKRKNTLNSSSTDTIWYAVG